MYKISLSDLIFEVEKVLPDLLTEIACTACNENTIYQMEQGLRR